jgi:ADP-heptose:LPS heptosyltransferase
VTFFADTIRHVLDGAPAGTRVWLLGTGDERSVGDALVRACADLDVTNLMGDTTLSVVIEMLKRSRLLLTNDSGPMHLAAALGVETVALFGPTDPERTGPYGSQHEVFASQVECAPCFERRCPLPKQLCLYDRSSPEAVSARVLEGLTRAPSRTTDG